MKKMIKESLSGKVGEGLPEIGSDLDGVALHGNLLHITSGESVGNQKDASSQVGVIASVADYRLGGKVAGGG